MRSASLQPPTNVSIPTRLAPLLERELARPGYEKVDRVALSQSLAQQPDQTLELLSNESRRLKRGASWRGWLEAATKLPLYALSAATGAAGVFGGVLTFSIGSSLSLASFGGWGLVGVAASGAAGLWLAKQGVKLAAKSVGLVAERIDYGSHLRNHNAHQLSNLTSKVERSLSFPDPSVAAPQLASPPPLKEQPQESWFLGTGPCQQIGWVGPTFWSEAKLVTVADQRVQSVAVESGNLLTEESLDYPLRGAVQSYLGNHYLASGGEVREYDSQGNLALTRGENYGPQQPAFCLTEQGGLVVSDLNQHAAYFEAGQETWRWHTLERFARPTPAPTVGPNQRAVIGGGQQLLSIPLETGIPVLESKFPFSITSRPAVGPNGHIVVGHSDGVASIDGQFGLTRWTSPEKTEFDPLVTPDNRLVLTRAHQVLGLNDENGQVEWRHGFRSPLLGPPLLDRYGHLIAVTQDGEVAVMDGQGHRTQSYDLGLSLSCAPTLAEDQLVVNTQEGLTFAYDLYDKA